MASEQSMPHVITLEVTEATKTVIMAVREAKDTYESRRAMQAVPKVSGQTLRQTTINWKSQDKFNKLKNFKIKVRNILMMNSYNIEESKKAPIIMNWLGYEGFKFSQTLYDNENEKC